MIPWPVVMIVCTALGALCIPARGQTRRLLQAAWALAALVGAAFGDAAAWVRVLVAVLAVVVAAVSVRGTGRAPASGPPALGS